MKKYIYLFLFFGVFTYASAQTIEQKVHEVTYVINMLTKEVKNKANNIPLNLGGLSSSCENFYFDGTPEDLKEIYKQVFTKERSNELKKTAFTIGCFCDKNGKIIETYFILFYSFDKINLDEIYRLEKVLKNTCLRIKGTCPNKQYYLFHMPCRFRDLYE